MTKEKHKEYNRKRYLKNREKTLIQVKQYAATHREEKKAYLKVYGPNYYLLHKEEKAAYGKKWREEHKGTLERKYKALISSAKQRNLAMTISFEEFKELQSKPCFYCAGSLPETGSGIDRINSDIGYVQGNYRPCCSICNPAKSDLTDAEFKEWVLRLYNHYGKT